MNFHRHQVVARNQDTWVNQAAAPLINSAVIAGQGRCEIRKVRRSVRHIAAENLSAVDVNNSAIVPQKVHYQIREGTRIRDVEVPPEIECNVRSTSRVRSRNKGLFRAPLLCQKFI